MTCSNAKEIGCIPGKNYRNYQQNGSTHRGIRARIREDQAAERAEREPYRYGLCRFPLSLADYAGGVLFSSCFDTTRYYPY